MALDEATMENGASGMSLSPLFHFIDPNFCINRSWALFQL